MHTSLQCKQYNTILRMLSFERLRQADNINLDMQQQNHKKTTTKKQTKKKPKKQKKITKNTKSQHRSFVFIVQ